MSVVNWLLIGRVLVISGSPCSFCCGEWGGAGRGERSWERGCSEAGRRHYAKKLCRGEKWGINHSQAFGSWKNDELSVIKNDKGTLHVAFPNPDECELGQTPLCGC